SSTPSSLLPFPTRRSSDLDRARSLYPAYQHHHRFAAANVIGFAEMTNAECRRNDKMTNGEEVMPTRIRHSGFIIDSSFVIRHSRSEEHTSELQSPYDLVCR